MGHFVDLNGREAGFHTGETHMGISIAPAISLLTRNRTFCGRQSPDPRFNSVEQADRIGETSKRPLASGLAGFSEAECRNHVVIRR